MHNTIINDIYDRISKILKNDQKYPYETMGGLITTCTSGVGDIESYYRTYPALVDIMELGGSLEHTDANHQIEIIRQIQYKMQQLRKALPDISE
jgi:hypothetical protein